MTDIEWEECLLEPRASPELEQRYIREDRPFQWDDPIPRRLQLAR